MLKPVDINKNQPAVNPDTVIESAKGQYESVLVLGYDDNGALDARASLNLQAKDILFLIESFKLKLLSGDYADE